MCCSGSGEHGAWLQPPVVSSFLYGWVTDTEYMEALEGVAIRDRALVLDDVLVVADLHVGRGASNVTEEFGELSRQTTGRGLEPQEVREYVPGDFAKNIDSSDPRVSTMGLVARDTLALADAARDAGSDEHGEPAGSTATST